MKRLALFVLLTLAWPTVGWGQDWGGTTVYQFADSVHMVYMRQNATNNNFGISTNIIIGNTATTDSITAIIRPVDDNRSPTESDDSAYAWFYFLEGGQVDAPGETMWVAVYVLLKDWREGTKNNATATLCDCSWDSAFTAPGSGCTATAWSSEGAKGSGTDREATPIDTIRFVGITATPGDTVAVRTSSGFTDTVGASNPIRIKVPGNKVDGFFQYGVVLIEIASVGDVTPNVQFSTDDHATAGLRPWMEGWESPSSTNVLSIGAATIGGNVVVGGK
jgi:hypothetical protein